MRRRNRAAEGTRARGHRHRPHRRLQRRGDLRCADGGRGRAGEDRRSDATRVDAGGHQPAQPPRPVEPPHARAVRLQRRVRPAGRPAHHGAAARGVRRHDLQRNEDPAVHHRDRFRDRRARRPLLGQHRGRDPRERRGAVRFQAAPGGWTAVRRRLPGRPAAGRRRDPGGRGGHSRPGLREPLPGGGDLRGALRLPDRERDDEQPAPPPRSARSPSARPRSASRSGSGSSRSRASSPPGSASSASSATRGPSAARSTGRRSASSARGRSTRRRARSCARRSRSRRRRARSSGRSPPRPPISSRCSMRSPITPES